MLDRIGVIGEVLTQEIAQTRLALEMGLADPAPVPHREDPRSGKKSSSRSA